MFIGIYHRDGRLELITQNWAYAASFMRQVPCAGALLRDRMKRLPRQLNKEDRDAHKARSTEIGFCEALRVQGAESRKGERIWAHRISCAGKISRIGPTICLSST